MSVAAMWKTDDRHAELTPQLLDNLHDKQESRANAISADGTIIAGWAYDGKNLNRKTAVVWKNNTITALDMPNEATSSWVTTISDDGAIMAGQICYGFSFNKSAAVVWNAQGQIIFQEFIPRNDGAKIIVSGHGSDFLTFVTDAAVILDILPKCLFSLNIFIICDK